MVTYEQRMREIESRNKFLKAVEHDHGVLQQSKLQVRWTRALVLSGLEHREYVFVLNRYFILRPLRDIEFLEIQRRIYGKDLTVEQFKEAQQNYLETLIRERKLIHESVALGLTLPEKPEKQWTAKEVGDLPMGVPRILYDRLSLISAFPPLVMPDSTKPA
jgi:hypothetical protein